MIFKTALACAVIALIDLGAATEVAAADAVTPRLGAYMDSVFGAGHWRETGGYRTPARENALRAQGALTVPAGVLSRHSVGRPDAPGAYDVVVEGVSPAKAAAQLRRASTPFRRVVAEAAHGTQGPHLHLELAPGDDQSGRPKSPLIPWIVEDPTPAQLAIGALQLQAAQGQADAQFRLGEAYELGRLVPRDLVVAYLWTSLAVTNRAAEPASIQQATLRLERLARELSPPELGQAQRLVRGVQSKISAECGTKRDDGPILLMASDLSGSTSDLGPRPNCSAPQTASARPIGPPHDAALEGTRIGSDVTPQ